MVEHLGAATVDDLLELDVEVPPRRGTEEIS